MTNTAGTLVAAQQSGLLDCITYMAGISGSCWALGILYSGINAKDGIPTPEQAAEQIKKRISLTFLDIATLELLTTPPTNKAGPFLRINLNLTLHI